MSERPTLYGYSPSTYVRTVRMVLIDNEVDYDQVSLNVLDGETRLPEHLAWQPFGKVPVLDIDGMRLREADPICRYLDETRDGPSLIPTDARARAKMATSITPMATARCSAWPPITCFRTSSAGRTTRCRRRSSRARDSSWAC